MLFHLCGRSKVGLGELNAYPSLPITLRTFGSNSYHSPVNRYFLGLVHKRRLDKIVFSQLVLFIFWGQKDLRAKQKEHKPRKTSRDL